MNGRIFLTTAPNLNTYSSNTMSSYAERYKIHFPSNFYSTTFQRENLYFLLHYLTDVVKLFFRLAIKSCKCDTAFLKNMK